MLYHAFPVDADRPDRSWLLYQKRKKHQEKIPELREELELEKQKRGLTGTDAATAAGNGRE